jgi:ATP-dependent DNA helicase RecQ
VCQLVERALLWLHEQEIIRLGKGLVVFRPAMTIRVAPGNSSFTRSDYAELQDHYNEQVVQIHVMAEYARRGLQAARDALRLAGDYFHLSREEFIRRWFPQAAKNLARQTTGESWSAIVESLSRVQRSVVTDEREQANVLVLAGPGSGKTRVLVHRIAFLVRVRRENSRGILALAYNRHAAAEIRRRLRELIGDDANGVTVLTCHALAMRLTGASFAERSIAETEFKQVIKDAVRLLKGEGLLADEADAQRERLLSGFRWILVDEYQDVEPDQYELISALAGRTLNDPERRLSLLAVGDDDQNVYSFQGASVEFIRRFQADYQAHAEYLTANYRSTSNIIEASNEMISRARNRMKADHPIGIDEARRNAPPGGAWETLDPVARGRVQVLNVESSSSLQAEMVMREMMRLAALDPAWDWSRAAIIARQWKLLHPVLAFCEVNRIPAQRADQDPPQFWRLRETQRLATWLSERGVQPIAPEEVDGWLAGQPGGPWRELLEEAARNYRLECGEGPLPAAHFREWLAEWGREVRRRQRGLLLLTAHRVKGLEFDHVAVLDGDWEDRGTEDDPDAARRLYYVAMTRARETLTLVRMPRRNLFLDGLMDLPSVFRRNAPAISEGSPGLDNRYEVLTPKDVDLGFAGRFLPNAPIHQIIDDLQPGDPLKLVREGERWTLLNTSDKFVGRLAKDYVPPGGMQCATARVHAVLVRFRADGEQAYADSVRCDRWEVVLPELVYVPVA